MNDGIDGYFGDPGVLKDQSRVIRRVGEDVGLHSPLIRRAGDSAADATGDAELAAAVRAATSHVASAVDNTSGTLGDVWHVGHTQAVALMRAFGQETA